MNALLRPRTLLVLGTLGTASVYAGQGCGGTSAETCDDLHDCAGGDGGLIEGDGTAPSLDGTTSSDGNVSADGPIGTENDGGEDAPTSNEDSGRDSAPSCDPTQTPSQNPCVISDALAVFVSPTGNDSTGAGTMASPVATIAKGVSLAQGPGARR